MTSRMNRALLLYRTKTDLVYEALRRSILAGRYRAGARINIDELTTELGTSKVPIREAIGRLIGEGLLQTSPHVGVIVPELSPNEILETSIIRAVIEGAAVRHSADHLSPAQIGRIKNLLVEMDELAVQMSPDYPKSNYDFHLATFDACPFETLKATATSLLEKTSRLGTVHFLPGYLPISQKQHWGLVHSLERKDGKTAERLVRRHVEESGRRLAQYALSHSTQPKASRSNPSN